MAKVYEWDYNNERPHKALGYLSPVLYAQKVLNQSNSEVLTSGSDKIFIKRTMKLYFRIVLI